MYRYIRQLPFFWLSVTAVILLLSLSFRSELLTRQSTPLLANLNSDWLRVMQLWCALGCTLLFVYCLPSSLRMRQSAGGWGFVRLFGVWMFCAGLVYAGLGTLHAAYVAQLTPLQRQHWLLTELLQQERAKEVANETVIQSPAKLQLRQLFFPPLLLDEPRYTTLSQAQIEAFIQKASSAQFSSTSVYSIQQMLDFNQTQLQPLILAYGYLMQRDNNLTGYSDAALQQMYQYVVDNFAAAKSELSAQASKIKIADSQLLQAEYEQNLRGALQQALSGLGRAQNFQQQLDANINYPALLLGQDHKKTELQQHLQVADVMLAGLWQQHHFMAIRHYYPFMFDLKSQCHIQAAAKPQWAFVLSKQPLRQWQVDQELPSAALIALQATFIFQITGQRVSAPQAILCDLSIETATRQRQALRTELEQQSAVYRHRHALEALAQPTHFQHRLFENQLKNQLLLRFISDNRTAQHPEITHPWLQHDDLLLRRFSSRTEFHQALSQLEYSSAAAFQRSMQHQFYLAFRTQLFQYAASLGVDLKAAWRNPDRSAKNARDLAQLPSLRAAIAHKLPFVFTPQGRLVEQVSDYQQLSAVQQHQLNTYSQQQLLQWYRALFFAAEVDYPQHAVQQRVLQWIELESQRIWLLLALTFLIWGLLLRFIALCVPAIAKMSSYGRGLLFSGWLLLPFVMSYGFAPAELSGGARFWQAGFQFNVMLQSLLDLWWQF